jgi:GNAT superfamily N-acetyltransferase
MHEESIVMELDLASADIADALDQLPLKDPGRWVDAYISLSNENRELKPGLVEVIGATEPETGLFVHYDNEITNGAQAQLSREAASVVRCVCDRSLAGVFDLVTDPEQRHRGNGRDIMKTALLWARRKGARKAWLQVVADNLPANRLYTSLGFREVYRYRYWKPGDA